MKPEFVRARLRSLATPVLTPLERLANLPPAARQLVTAGVLRLADSKMLIEDPLTPFNIASRPQSATETPAAFGREDRIERIIEQATGEGLKPAFHNLMQEFAYTLIDVCGNPSQQALVADWLSRGFVGSYLMTDAGGPGISDWQTSLREDGGQLHVRVNKLWAIEAHRAEFLLVVARPQRGFLPLTFLLDPARVATLDRAPVGQPFLEGHLQLGNVQGEVPVFPEDILRQGGLAVVNKALTFARPRFVRALMAHLTWLETEGRLLLDETDRSLVQCVVQAADTICTRKSFSRESVDDVLATKYLANELLLKLVVSGCVEQAGDERDLLAFSKMEGSSYRCFLELYSKHKARRS